MRTSLWVLCCVLVALFGCGGDDSNGSGSGGTSGQGGGAAGQSAGGFDAGTDPNRNDVSPGGICARLAVINCAGEQACCDDVDRTFDACRQMVEATCSGTYMLDQIAGAPQVGFDAAGARTAFTQLEQRASMCDPSVAAWAVSPQGFPVSFTGTLGAGENCEPAGGLEAPIPDLLTALASCRLGEGVACLPAESGWTCSARAAAGGRCFTDLNCNDGLYCDNPEDDFNGTCAARKAEGESCGGATECASFVCKGGLCTATNDVQAAYCLN